MTDVPHHIRSWFVLLRIFIQYGCYRMGLRQRPTFRNNMFDCMVVIGRVLHWRDRLRIVGVEHCPTEEPAVFCSNHIKKDDPFVTGASIFLSSGKRIWTYYMMRDNFFGPGKARWLYDPDELLYMLGARHISRERVTLQQLKVYIDLLKNGESFLMYPGRSRSRSGLVMEYRDGIEEPGGPAFFVAQAQRFRDQPIPIIPLVRCFNPVKKTTTVVFGEAIYLASSANRKEQRTADFAVAEAIGDLIEISGAHLVAGIIYLRCLHGYHMPFSVNTLCSQVTQAAATLSDRHVDPNVLSDPDGESRTALDYLAYHGMVSVQDNAITPLPSAVLATPPLDASFRTANPVKFLVNQFLHLHDVVAAIEDAVQFLTPPSH